MNSLNLRLRYSPIDLLLFYCSLNTLIIKRLYATSGKRLSKSDRALLTLPKYAFEALIGIMLGDGHINQRSLTGNARFLYGQSGKEAKRAYFEHVYDLFKPFCTPDSKYYLKTWIDTRSGTERTSISFVTMQLPCFSVFRKMFYLDGIKIVPVDIYNNLTAVGLAYWIMDDGSKSGQGLHLNTYCFDQQSIDRLLFVLKEKFSLECTIHNHTGGQGGAAALQPRIFISSTSMSRLRELVSPYIVSSMQYKIK